MISANTDEENIMRGFRAGCNDFIRKPFSRAEVLARVNTQVKLREFWQKEMSEVKNSAESPLPAHVVSETLKS